jgi:hypothetical protein
MNDYQENEQPSAVDVKQAVRIAVRYVADLYDVDTRNVVLEEVERGSDSWYITVGFNRAKPPQAQSPWSGLSTLAEAMNPNTERVYKVIQVSAKDGEPVSMKIRPLPA